MLALERLRTYFEENSVPYDVQEHPVAYTAQKTAEADHVPGEEMAKVVIVMEGRQPIMLVLAAPLHVSWPRLQRMLGDGEPRLAQEDEFARYFPDCEAGAMPPFGNLYGIPVYVDRGLAEQESIYFPAGTHDHTVSVPFDEFRRLVDPVIADFAVAD